LSKELGQEQSDLPNFVAVAPYTQFSPAAYGPGFLGPNFAPLVVGDANRAVATPMGPNYDQSLAVKNLALPRGVNLERADARLSLLGELEADFASGRPGLNSESHRSAYAAAVRMMRSEAVKAFQLEEETEKLRDAYGRNQFGQACLLARRLVERGVRFIQLYHRDWDHHGGLPDRMVQQCKETDQASSALIQDLKQRGLLDETLVVCMSEFGRTPKMNVVAGRDHWGSVFSIALAGGGIRGGTVYGVSDEIGAFPKNGRVGPEDLTATILHCLGIAPDSEFLDAQGRTHVVSRGQAIQPILA
jgi:uncharacterized protein (DUF1501 family)